MASAEDERRKRQREREDEEEEEEKRKKLGLKPSSGQGSYGPKTETEKLDELSQRADVMVDQLNNLYNMFISGVDQIPPTERRKQLDQIMNTLQLMSKPTPSSQFKYSALQGRYVSHRDRWDKMMKDLEDGKIKRMIGKKR